MIERDENYLEDMLIDIISESVQTEMKEKKNLLDISKKEFGIFKEEIINLLNTLFKEKHSYIKIDDKQNMITLSYIQLVLKILNEWEKYESHALELEGYYRSVENMKADELFEHLVIKNDNMDMVIDVSEHTTLWSFELHLIFNFYPTI